MNYYDVAVLHGRYQTLDKAVRKERNAGIRAVLKEQRHVAFTTWQRAETAYRDYREQVKEDKCLIGNGRP